MSTIAQALLTAEAFARLPNPEDGSTQELVRGVIFTMPPPKALHGACCSRLASRLNQFVELNRLGNVFTNDTGWITQRDPDTVRGADIAFWSYQRLPSLPEEYIDVPPELAVEVLSLKQTPADVADKLQEYFTQGTERVWIVIPPTKTIRVYRNVDSFQTLDSAANLLGEGVLAGFSCPVAEIFP